MAITTYPLNNITYDAEDAELFHCTRRSGVFMGSSGNTEYSDFDATVTGSSRAITIQPGLAWIRNGRFKGKAVCVDAPVSITLGASNATYPRYDAIVLRFLPLTNESQLISVQGGASSNPSRPTPLRVENGTYDLHLYHVYRPAGSSVVTSADVEDMRADLNYCGYMVDDVSAFDEGKFLSKEDYDPSDTVAKAGGIAQYVQTNSPKVTLSDSVSSTSTTTAASSKAVKTAYDLANGALPKNQKNAANGVAPLNSSSKVPIANLPYSVSTSSSSTTTLATSSAVKEAHDKAVEALPFIIDATGTDTDNISINTNFSAVNSAYLSGRLLVLRVNNLYIYCLSQAYPNNMYTFTNCDSNGYIRQITFNEGSGFTGSVHHSEGDFIPYLEFN